MLSEYVKKAIYYSGKNMAQVAAQIGQSRSLFQSKIKRNSFSDEELKMIADAIGCKYKCYFDFEDGNKFGNF